MDKIKSLLSPDLNPRAFSRPTNSEHVHEYVLILGDRSIYVEIDDRTGDFVKYEVILGTSEKQLIIMAQWVDYILRPMFNPPPVEEIPVQTFLDLIKQTPKQP